MEKKEGVASTWVSPIVVIPQDNNEILMCIDLRKLNQAVFCERYPIPTMPGMLVELNNTRVFSKLDLKLRFFQLEFDENSQEIITFTTEVNFT